MRKRFAVLLTMAALIIACFAMTAPTANAVNFNLCSDWSGWRYGGDGFDYLSSYRVRSGGVTYHYYYRHSVLNGNYTFWRQIC